MAAKLEPLPARLPYSVLGSGRSPHSSGSAHRPDSSDLRGWDLIGRISLTTQFQELTISLTAMFHCYKFGRACHKHTTLLVNTGNEVNTGSSVETIHQLQLPAVSYPLHGNNRAHPCFMCCEPVTSELFCHVEPNKSRIIQSMLEHTCLIWLYEHVI
jgi:hypothetical protein